MKFVGQIISLQVNGKELLAPGQTAQIKYDWKGFSENPILLIRIPEWRISEILGLTKEK